MRGPSRPTRIPTDILRQRTWDALKAAQPSRSGTMPAVDHVFQAVYVLGNAGLDTKTIARALQISENYARVARRNNAKRLMPTVGETPKKEKREQAIRNLANVPDHPIGTLHTLVERLSTQIDDWIVETGDTDEARKLGREDLVQRIKARDEVAS